MTHSVQDQIAPLAQLFSALHRVLTRVIQEQRIQSLEELDRALNLPRNVVFSLTPKTTSLFLLLRLAEGTRIPVHELVYLLEPDAFGNPARTTTSAPDQP